MVGCSVVPPVLMLKSGRLSDMVFLFVLVRAFVGMEKQIILFCFALKLHYLCIRPHAKNGQRWVREIFL